MSVCSLVHETCLSLLGRGRDGFTCVSPEAEHVTRLTPRQTCVEPLCPFALIVHCHTLYTFDEAWVVLGTGPRVSFPPNSYAWLLYLYVYLI